MLLLGSDSQHDSLVYFNNIFCKTGDCNRWILDLINELLCIRVWFNECSNFLKILRMRINWGNVQEWQILLSSGCVLEEMLYSIPGRFFVEQQHQKCQDCDHILRGMHEWFYLNDVIHWYNVILIVLRITCLLTFFLHWWLIHEWFLNRHFLDWFLIKNNLCFWYGCPSFWWQDFRRISSIAPI